MHDQQCDDMLMNFIHLTKGYTNSLCPSALKLLHLVSYLDTKGKCKKFFLLVMLAMCFFGNFSLI
jgi:hypothetical protein